MSNFKYNDRLEQLEVDAPSGEVETAFMVPPIIHDGDRLVPLHIKAFDGQHQFWFFGRYSASKDMAEFAVTGPPGYGYSVRFMDDNGERGGRWKADHYGETKGVVSKADSVLRYVANIMNGRAVSADYKREIVQADAFRAEDVMRIPLPMMRLPAVYEVAPRELDVAVRSDGYVYGWTLCGDFKRFVFRCGLTIKFFELNGQVPRAYAQEDSLLTFFFLNFNAF